MVVDRRERFEKPLNHPFACDGVQGTVNGAEHPARALSRSFSFRC